VEFAGHLERDEVQRRLSGAWVQVVPSLWPEPFGLVTVEAMARGRVVVASRVGAQPELVTEDVTGHLVPAGDAAALAGALERLVSDRSALERMGEAARTAARTRFNLDLMIEQYISLYERLLQDRERAT
jgi:glycosyltransferase involved in cell wall biosynthesis